MAEENNMFDVNFNTLDNEAGDLIDVDFTSDDVPTDGDTEPTIESEVIETPEAEAKPAEEKKPAPTAEDEVPELAPIDVDIENKVQGNEAPETSEVDSSPAITPFASLLQDKGLLPNLDMEEFKKSEDPIGSLIEAMKGEIEFQNNRFISAFPEEMVEMAKAVASGVPFESLKDVKAAQLNYKSIDPESLSENEELSKTLIKELLTSKGVKEAKINKFISLAEENAELDVEGKDALSELLEMSTAAEKARIATHKQEQEALERANQETMNKIKGDISAKSEIIPGMNLTDRVKETIYDSMTQIVAKDVHGNHLNTISAERAKDPVGFDMNVAYLMHVTKNFTDWSKLGKTAKTNATKEFEKALKGNTKTVDQGLPKSAPNAETDLLGSLETLFGKQN